MFFEELRRKFPTLKFLRHTGSLKCANGSPIEVIGYTALTVSIGSHHFAAKYAIVNKIFPKVIIGLRTMKKESINILPAIDAIEIQGDILPFISKTNITEN